jgi:5-methylcytosine-specific restriction protein A
VSESSRPRNKIDVAVALCDPPLDEYELWVAEWALRHSDASHPGDRATCNHCQLMMEAFGDMPPAADIERVAARLLNARKQGLRRKKPIPKDLRWEVWERDNFTCQHCGVRRHLAVDHIIPESRGGTLDLDNLQTLCVSCNGRKGAR